MKDMARELARELHRACEEGKGLEEWLETNAEAVRYKGPHNSVLHYCAAEGWVEAAEELLESGADANVRNGAGWTPLDFAFAAGKEDPSRMYPIFDLLLERGAIWRHRTLDGWEWDLPMRAISMNPDHYTAGVDYIKGYIAREAREILFQAAPALGLCDENGRTGLHYAAEERDWKRVEAHLEQGAPAENPDHAGDCAAALAARSGDPRGYALFRKYGVSLLAPSRNGGNLLHAAAAGGSGEIVSSMSEQVLRLKGAPVESINLVAAALGTKGPFTRREAVNKLNDNNQTPLYIAAGSQSAEAPQMVKTLLAYGTRLVEEDSLFCPVLEAFNANRPDTGYILLTELWRSHPKQVAKDYPFYLENSIRLGSRKLVDCLMDPKLTRTLETYEEWEPYVEQSRKAADKAHFMNDEHSLAVAQAIHGMIALSAVDTISKERPGGPAPLSAAA